MGAKILKLIEASGNPYEIGFQHGSKATSEVVLSIETYKKMFLNYSNLTWEEAKRRANLYIEPIKGFSPSLVEEMQGIADGAGVELLDIIALNARSEVVMMQNSSSLDGCTSLSAMPEVTANGNVILAQNWDWKGSQLESVILLKIKQPGKPEILMATEAGILGKIGFNSAGLGVCLNALGTVGHVEEVPLHIILRGILEAEKISDAIEKINSMPNACAANYLIAHANGESVDMEKTPTDFDIFYAENGYLAHSNHFLTTRMQVVDTSRLMAPDSFIRVGRTNKLLKKQAGNIDIDYVKKILTDHVEFPDSICRHNDPLDDVRFQMCTVFSIIMDLTTGKMEIAKGNPCENPYIEYQL